MMLIDDLAFEMVVGCFSVKLQYDIMMPAHEEGVSRMPERELVEC